MTGDGHRRDARRWLRERLPKAWARLRTWLLPGVLLLALYFFADKVGQGFPLDNWYLWRFVGYWLLAGVFSVSCLAGGHAVLRRVLRSPLPLLEHVTLSGALGVLLFFFVMFGLGLAHAYGPVAFALVPLLLLAVGGKSAFRYARRVVRHVAWRRRRKRARPPALGKLALWGLGLIALFLFYLPSIVPAHLGYDSHWYHLPLAEHYASLGGIERFPEGWYMGGVPHLASVIYCWAFLLPGSQLFDRVELAAHLEFAVFLLMLPGIPALVRRLVPGARAHLGWIAIFAFPTLYWHDLLIIADQFAALWTLPIVLAFLRVHPRFDLRYALVLGAMLAGALVTKLSALGILVLPGLALPLRALWLTFRALRAGQTRNALATVGAAFGLAAATLALSAPFWAKNWVFYGNPMFPVPSSWFESRPWSPDATTNASLFMRELAVTQAPRSWEGFQSSLWAALLHSFDPMDYTTSRDRYRGSLFTLLCFCLPFVRASGRLWATALIAVASVVGWYWISFQDRYLMAFLPVMSGVIVSICVLIWRSSLPARLALWALVAFHTAFGLGVFALSNPASHYREVIDFVVAASARSPNAGLGELAPWQSLEKELPESAKVLVHDMHGHTGLGRPSVNDWPITQTGLSYGSMASAAEVRDTLAKMGVTHMLWSDANTQEDSIAGNLRFFEFALLHAKPRRVGSFWLAKLPARVTRSPTPNLVSVLSCKGAPRAGRYPLLALNLASPRRQPEAHYPAPQRGYDTTTDLTPELADAGYVVLDASCGFSLSADWTRAFERIGRRGTYELYARRP
jgi:hypothetical protein